ncbi:MAG: hypothetical protein SFU91_04290 [Chloroherpetonaceae bacterium]|nr:hypothetical protein [Chloroherpetonaceae bacterium]
MTNFSEVLSVFNGIQGVIGVSVVDSDGMHLVSSFPGTEFNDALSPVICYLTSDATKHLQVLGESPNQVCISMSDKLIIIQLVYDLILVVYSQKRNLHAVQTAIESASLILNRIATVEFSNT